ncbi:hypothetical protein SUSAZ_09875 [Sulfolobus acidocaldarius SUSAZ]|nr:hypothetical protein SUSAZ_09875 [Sulfolobus acidocaldarius SUSAZ]
MLSTGFSTLDRIIQRDEIVEFYSTDHNLLYEFYHRVIVVSSPVKVIIVGERGGLNPLLIERFKRIFQRDGDIYIRRAFKVEDVRPTIEEMGDEFILINPYHHGKNYTEIVAGIRKTKGRKFLFSSMDREVNGSLFGSHSVHSMIRLERGERGFKAIVVKSVILKEVEIPFGYWEIFGKDEGEGLMKWIVT